METRLTRRPGQAGTKKYIERYGEKLVCVRYRYDSANGRRHKTVELIVETVPWGDSESARYVLCLFTAMAQHGPPRSQLVAAL